MFIKEKGPNLVKFVYLIGFVFLFGCSKGFTLKIKDQDFLAFGAQESCNFMTATVFSNSLRVSWKTSTPATFVISSSVPTEFDVDIKNAAAKWNSVVGSTLITVVRDNSFANPPGNDGVNGIYWMTTWEDANATQQARTAVRWDISKIVDADIRINAKDFQFYKTGDLNSSGKVNFESLILHELGHGLGLTHIAESDSVMQIYLQLQTLRNQPGAIDRSSLKCEY